jgi:CheY-like chemotaxis protein/AcrR family transcriptional regulator
MITREMLLVYTKDALRNLFSPAHLQTHPLGNLVLPQDTPEQTRAQALRQAITEEIERLRPAGAVSFGQPEWLPYRIICMHHIEGRSVEEVCKEIGLAHTSFYRYYREARESLASLLWERYYRLEQAISADESKNPGPEGQALKEAVRLATATPREWLDPGEILKDVCRLVAPFAEGKGVSVVLEVGTLAAVYAERGILRQAFVSLITEAVKLVRPPSLRISASESGGSVLLVLGDLDLPETDEPLKKLGGLSLCQALFGVYGGRVWVEPSGASSALCLALRGDRPKTILIIDDDRDTIELYLRYLGSTEYDVNVWDRKGGITLALATVRPDLVLLDMLMPEPDGWRVLQEITASAECAGVPVVVCSVLNQPELALSLGAVRVLQKPISQTELLQAVGEVLRPQSLLP